jgi:hypothetical protein
MPIFPRDRREQNENEGDEMTKREIERLMRKIQLHLKKTARESSKKFLSQFGL